MSQANYDHPSYLTRQLLHFAASTAGANGTSAQVALPWDVNVHNLSAVVLTAGTATTNQAILLSGTATVGSVALSTNAAGYVGTSGDLATKITAGTLISIKNGADATGVCRCTIDYNLAPDTATWLGHE